MEYPEWIDKKGKSHPGLSHTLIADELFPDAEYPENRCCEAGYIRMAPNYFKDYDTFDDFLILIAVRTWDDSFYRTRFTQPQIDALWDRWYAWRNGTTA